MNKDQVKGTVKEVAGKVQKAFGEAVGSTDHRVKGAIKEAQGKGQQVVGDAKQLIKDATKP